MIGIGTWEAQINTMIFKGTGRMTIADNNGEYDFKFEIVGAQIPEIKISDIKEDGNTLTATAECDLLKGKQVPLTITFDGDKLTGMVKAPFIGKVKLEGTKIA